MRYSQAFVPTVKEVPKDATMPSHILMLRAGLARMVGAGIYEFLPLGTRVLHHVETIVREEMDRAGAQEILMPTLLPAEYFQQTGRWDLYGATLFRLHDRKAGDYHLAPTHEEIVTDLVRREVRSYKQLPLNLYQVQTKFRDEPRPRAGLLRCREFIMKDAYSFDADVEGAQRSYEIMREAYHRIFQRLGLDYRVVQADSGAIGGKTSAEFQVLAQTGEDSIVACDHCDYAANVEVAESKLPEPADRSVKLGEVEKVRTPKVKSIDDVLEFFENQIPIEQTIKSLLYAAGDTFVMAVVRGDRTVNEIKLATYLGVDELRAATEDEVKTTVGAAPGFVGPVGFNGRIVVDLEAATVVNAVAGANENPFHVKNVNFDRDYLGDVVAIRSVGRGDACPQCGNPLSEYRGIEGGHIFILGTHYSEKMEANFVDAEGRTKPVVMGCYGIGVSRLIAAIIEQHHDENGTIWPISVAPYQIMLTALGTDGEVKTVADELYNALEISGATVLYDDRDERPGVKFKDADLLGLPLRITIGARGIKNGEAEYQLRSESQARSVPIANVVEFALAEIARLQNK
ncbi:MAG: proline--tRNA ligase [Polyangiales bacterium]